MDYKRLSKILVKQFVCSFGIVDMVTFLVKEGYDANEISDIMNEPVEEIRNIIYLYIGGNR